MQTKYQDNPLTPESVKPIDLSDCSLNVICQKNFIHGLHNARNILASLERSIEKSNSYEDRLLQCRLTHKHSHDFNDWSWDTDFSDDKDFKSPKANSGSNNPSQVHNSVNVGESWSTMSIVCLQYQYEELAKRYESLLKAFNDQCSVISAKNSTLSRLHHRARVLNAQLASTHRALLCVGEKYLTLKKRSHEQVFFPKLQNSNKNVAFLKMSMRDVIATAEKARIQIDNKIARSMAVEQSSEYSLLLAEMKKCNQLFLENLQLKAHLEEFVPDSVSYTKYVKAHENSSF